AYSFSASGDYCLRRDIFAGICLILLIIDRHLQVLPSHLRPNALAARTLTHAQRVIAGKDPEDWAVFEDASQAADFLDSLA
ncbi:MAG: hypothetical protein E6165_05270, partial [Varibaculum cambriense]|nr:hypothetical protein [Varibaculum cambriense]